MIKIVDNDLWRESSKVGFIEENRIFDENGRKVGYCTGNEIFDDRGIKIGYLAEGQLFGADGNKIANTDDLSESVKGVTNDLMRGAIRILVGD